MIKRLYSLKKGDHGNAKNYLVITLTSIAVRYIILCFSIAPK